jgi:glutamate 5-kinase
MSTKIVAARLATSAGVTTVITRSSSPGNIVKIVKHIQASRSPPSMATKGNQTPPSASEPTLADQSHPASPSSPTPSESEHSLTPIPQVPLHTRFLPSPHPVRDRYFWILHGLRPHGTLYIDQGAYKALVNKAGLLPVGVVGVDGVFGQQEAVRLCVVDRVRSRKTTTASPGGGGEDGSGRGKLWEGEAREVGRALSNYSNVEIARIKGRQSVEVEGILGYADSEYVAQRESISFFDGAARDSRPVTPRPLTPVTPARGVVERGGLGGYEGEGAVL